MILSGFAVPLFQALITCPQMRVALGTAIPDMAPETGHCSMPVSMRKCLLFVLFRSIEPYFAIPDNITADSHKVQRDGDPNGNRTHAAAVKGRCPNR